MTKGQGVAGIIAVRAQNGTYQRDADPTSHMADSIKKPALKLLEMPCLQSSPIGPWVPPTFCMPHPHSTTSQPCGWLPVYTPEDGGSKALQIASEHVCTCVES